MSEVRTEFTGDATSLAEATAKAQEGITGVLEVTDKASARLGQLNQIVELAAKAQKGLTVASGFLATGTAAVTAAVKAQTVAFLSSPLAPVAVAVLALGAAYAKLSADLDDANDKVEESAKAAARAQKEFDKLADLRQKVTDRELLATGKATQAELDLRDALADVTAVYGPRIAAQKAAIEAAKAEGKGTAEMEAALAGLEEQQGKLIQSTTRGILLADKGAKGGRAKAAADKAGAAAVDEAAAAERRWAEALAEGTIYNLDAAMAASKKRAKVEEDNAQIIADAAVESAQRQMEAEEELRVRRIEMDRAYTEQVRQGAKDREEINRQYAESALGIAKESLGFVVDLAKRELDQRTTIIDTLQARLADGEDSLTEHQKERLKDRIAATKEAAIVAFNISKAVAAAQAAVSTALAVINALASPVPYPVAVGFSIAAGIAGAASIAAILSEPEPTFHRGGVFLPDEGSATLRRGEGVLTPETTRNLGGAPGIAEMNRRQGMASGGIVLRIGRREVSEMERIGVRAGGPRNRQIRNEIRRGSIIAGRSGKGVLA